MPLRRLPWRSFLYAFILTLCVLGLLLAFFVIECRIQQTTRGRVDLGVTYTIEQGAPVIAVRGGTHAAPPAVDTAAETLLPPPVRLLAVVWRAENALAAWIWELVAE